MRSTLLLALIFGVMVVGSLGCANGGRLSQGDGIPDREVADLNYGVSVGAVKAEFGAPSHEEGTPDERVLSYGLWRLVFSDDHLARKIKPTSPRGLEHPFAAELPTTRFSS